MRMLMITKSSTTRFNAGVRDGSADRTLRRIVDELRPEAVYFTELEGKRAAILVVDVQDAAEIPRYAEPFFLAFDAEVEFHPVMSAEDLGRAGIAELGEKWA